jgi:N6-L-threonylcarbamoyladenine synthase
MICLGIESTAHTFGISVVDDHDKKVLSNIITAFKTQSGGMIPAKVAEHHVEVLDDTLKDQALATP